MRLRKKWWAIPEMEACPQVTFEPQKYRGNWQQRFSRSADIHLELGCGRMKFLLEMGRRYPETDFIGVDMVAEAMVYGVRKLTETKLPNVNVIVMDIRQILTAFAPDEIAKIYIHFCNPWPKAKQQKRRLTHPRQLMQYREFLRDGGVIELKTDDPGLYEDSSEYFSECGFEILSRTADLALADDAEGIISDYEARWRGEGVPIKRIIARKLPDSALPWDRQEAPEIWPAQAVDLENRNV